MPRRRSSCTRGSTPRSTSRSTASDPSAGTGAYAPMPPVLGPVSSSPTRLKSCAGTRGATAAPSHRTRSEHSGPARPSSITTRRPASPNAPESFASTSDSASASVSATSTPFPAARPSVFTTHGPGSARRNRRASSKRENTPYRAVGTPAAARTSFMKPLDPSSRAPSAPGPTTRRPDARRRSASPATSGASGPMTKRSASTSSGGAEVTAIGAVPCPQPSPPAHGPARIPWFPGVTTTSEVQARARASACSRPPEPMMQTFTRSRRGKRHELLPPRSDADETHRDADLVRQELHVVEGRGRQLARGGEPGEVGLPPGELLVHGGDLVQRRLVVRRQRVPLAALLVRDADPEGLEGVEHVELRERDLGQRIQPHGLARHHRVEPPGASPPARDGPELVATLDEHLAEIVVEFRRERPGPDARDVGLGDTDDPVDGARSEPAAGAGAARNGVR